jgi:hypothetical protein
MRALFEESLSKISHFKCVVDSLALGGLRKEALGEESEMEEMSCQCQEHKEEVTGLPL